ncbi:MAG: EAL domain-containing protein [Chakrabartia sp.]
MMAVILLLAAQGLFSPLDDAMRSVRNQFHRHPATAPLAIVAIDDAATSQQGEWPWPRTKIAQLVRALDAAGARQIAFEHLFPADPDRAGTQDLARALQSLPKRPILAATVDRTGTGPDVRLTLPDPRLAQSAQLAVRTLEPDAFGRPWTVQGQYQVEGRLYPSLSAALANQPPHPATYIVDYATHPGSIVQVSAADVMAGRAGQLLAGRTVLVSSIKVSMLLPGIGGSAPALVHALGAETISAGQQYDFGTFPALALGLGLAMLIWRGQRRHVVHGLGWSVAIFGALPIWVESHRIFFGVAGALALVLAALLLRIWRSYRQGGERTNQLSGLPNLLALREYTLAPQDIVVAIRIKNYPQLAAALSRQEAELAQQIVQRLSAGGTTPLFHGDEGLLCWIADQTQAEDLPQHLEAMHSLFLMPVWVGATQVDIALAFGIDMTASDDASLRFSSALIAADEASTTAARWKYFDSRRHDEAEWQASLLGKLDAAIDSGEVWVAFQPKQDIRAGRVAGAEALARWSHPERGAIPPDEFIPVAEAHGRIDKLTYFVLEESLTLAAMMGPTFNIAVNLSASMFSRTDFVSRLSDMLAAAGVSPSQLTLEVTESVAAQSEQAMVETLDALVALGVTIAIDDYGTGYSTLDYLKKIRASELKIDRSFVGAMAQSRSDQLLVNATIRLAHSLGQSVVAEGVETAETLDMLRRMNCDEAQGYLIARPMPRADFLRFMDGIPSRAA